MLNEDNDNIEGFFRKATSRYDDSFNENDWRKMEKMLDEEEKKRAALKAQRQTIGRAVIGVVGLLILITFFIVNTNSDNPDKQATVAEANEQTAQERSSENSAGKIADETTVPAEENNPLSSTDQKEPQDQYQTKKLLAPGTNAGSDRQGTNADRAASHTDRKPTNAGKTAVNSTGYGIAEPAGADSKNSPGDTNSEQKDQRVIAVPDEKSNLSQDAGPDAIVNHNNENNQGEADPVSGDVQHHDKQITPNTSSNDSLSTASRQLAEYESNASQEKEYRPVSMSSQEAPEHAKDSSVLKTDTVSKALEKEEKSFDEDEDSEEPARWPSSRWSISFVVAPDFSRTTSGSYANPGDAFGLLINYKFLNRWSLSTGALRSYKNYRSNGDEYTPPKGYWIRKTNGVIPEKIDGNCVVLEIPLSLTFDFLETKRSRMFASAGVSSYFMMNQQYNYIFEAPNPGAATRWHSDEHEAYSFSVGTLTLGYEYLLKPTLSIGLEPYYKIPFGGVGWGNVNLYSAGVYVVGRYRFLRNK